MKLSYALNKVASLRLHTVYDYIILELQQTHEYKLLTEHGINFPNDFTTSVQKEIKLLSVEGSQLSGDQFMLLRKLSESIERIFRWFNHERRLAYKGLEKVIDGITYDKKIIEYIDEVLDERGVVKDNASPELQRIRQSLYKKRNELRRTFDKIIARLTKAGYTAEIDESFSNGRRVAAVFSEHKRQVKGILHGESDSRKTAFIEPEETIGLNNDVSSLEHEEVREVQKILRALTAKLRPYSGQLSGWQNVIGEFDFIRAKAKFAQDIDGHFPNVVNKATIQLTDAYHPLLFLYNKKAGKKTIPLNLKLHDDNRILIISGPNAGGKTVTMKTIGLIQMMVQAGLLVPVNPVSEIGVFKQIFIHIGDTQSLEFELSTYSSHLLHMKHFIENANGKTLFFIDELGSGSDPNLGGAFAEVILEELSRRHAIGIVTTHYLNLKVMANHTSGIFNGAMAFDEQNLQPLYKLTTGKPGSSYTFSIAERIGLPKHLINRARKLVEEDHFRLDKLLNRTEQDLQQLHTEKIKIQQLIKDNSALKKELENALQNDRHTKQVELLKHQNTQTEERIAYLKEMERKLKSIVAGWKNTENKEEMIMQLRNVLFEKKEKAIQQKMAKKIDARYREVTKAIEVGVHVKMKKNNQVGVIKEIRGKRAVILVGQLPINVEINDLITVEERALAL